MNNFGKTIHNLRTRRKMTQQELAQDLFDRSTISKIENNELSTTYENEIKLITRLGLTPNEFEYISNSYQVGTKDQLLYRFLNLDDNVDQEEINGLLQDCLFVKNDEDIKRIAIILKSLLLVNNAAAPAHARELVQPIWFNYLRNIEVFTITDITILNSILFAFDYQTANEIITKIITNLDNRYPFMKELKANTLINQAIIQMKEHQFKSAVSILNSLQPLLKSLRQYDKLLVVNARIAICQNDKQKALEQVDLLQKIGAANLAKSLEQEVKQFL
ncbi:hypothetical protein LACWKB8_1649 [Lactobacillus sp. wkB8]|nr:hypothetical protein LACWKB8_1649 [Lactobacillus sp. wkB8]